MSRTACAPSGFSFSLRRHSVVMLRCHRPRGHPPVQGPDHEAEDQRRPPGAAGQEEPGQVRRLVEGKVLRGGGERRGLSAGRCSSRCLAVGGLARSGVGQVWRTRASCTGPPPPRACRTAPLHPLTRVPPAGDAPPRAVKSTTTTTESSTRTFAIARAKNTCTSFMHLLFACQGI